MTAGLSVLMPALNEARNIEAAVRGVLAVADDMGLDVEVLVLTCDDRDGNGDGTAGIARRLAGEDGRVRVVHSPRYQLLGEKFRDGIERASKPHLVMIPGDNENDPGSFRGAFSRLDEADLILCCPANPEVRPWHRRLLSRAYTSLLNLLFGRRIAYYNGMNVYPTADLRRHPPRSDSFALGAESVLRLLAAGKSYIEVPVRLQPRHGRSKALRLDNVLRVVGEVVHLWWTVRRGAEPGGQGPGVRGQGRN